MSNEKPLNDDSKEELTFIEFWKEIFTQFYNEFIRIVQNLSIRQKIFLITSFIFATTIHFTLMGPNPTSRFLLTKAIVEDNQFFFPLSSLDLYNLSPDYARIGNNLFSDKAPGLSFFLVPLFIVGEIIGTIMPFIFEPFTSIYPAGDIYNIVTIQFGLSLFAAYGIVRIYDISKLFNISDKSSIISSFIVAFATPYWVYASTMFPHVPAAVFLINALYFTLKYRKTREIESLILAGFFSGFGMVIDYPLLFSIPWITVLIITPLNNLEKNLKEKTLHLMVYWSVSIVSILPLFLYNLINFDSLTANAYQFSHWAERIHFLNPLHEGLSLLLISNARGLFYFSPILILGLIGIYMLFRKYPLESVVIFSLILSIVVFYAKNWAPEGGAAFGPRYLIPVIPLLGLGLGIIYENISTDLIFKRALLTVTFVWSFFVAFIGSYYAVMVFSAIDSGIDPIFDEVMPKVLAGKLISPLAIFLPIEFLLLGALLYFIIFQGKVPNLELRTNTGEVPKELNSEYNYYEAALLFGWGNFLFLGSFLLFFVKVLSGTYIKLYNEREPTPYIFEIPVSDLWILFGFLIIVIYSTYLFYTRYRTDIQEFKEKILG